MSKKKAVLAIGIEPSLVDFSAFRPGLVACNAMAREDFIEQLRAMGYDADSCLIDLGDTAEAVATKALRSQQFDCVMIGAGLRQPGERLILFEKVINLIHRLAPQASICFNTNPADSADAVRRWITP